MIEQNSRGRSWSEFQAPAAKPDEFWTMWDQCWAKSGRCCQLRPGLDQHRSTHVPDSSFVAAAARKSLQKCPRALLFEQFSSIVPGSVPQPVRRGAFVCEHFSTFVSRRPPRAAATFFCSTCVFQRVGILGVRRHNSRRDPWRDGIHARRDRRDPFATDTL